MSPFYLQLSTFVLPLFIGVILLVASKYTRIPNIILLLVGGVLLGPEFFGLVDPKSTGEGLKLIISMCVAVILFEGGLTLHRDGIKKATTVIWRLLTIGVLITWLGTAAVIHFIMGYPISMSLAAGSLVIVTGPTVIAPLLKRIQIKENLYHILHWEGVLIDPIGVFIAILCFEWISIEGGFLTHVWHLGLRAFAGVVIGFAGGWIISVLLKQEIIPEKQGNIFVFSSALFLFGLSDFIIHESGILTVVVAGLVVGWANPPMLKYIQQFKSDLTDLAIALVFILLAANLDLWQFLILGWEMLLILGCVLFLIRPLSIFFCTFGSQLVTKEKLFLSWIAPRGVVAGSMASLYGLQLVVKDYPNALFFETFTFSVIAATIILQGGSAGIFAKWLQVKQLEKKGWLIVGAHQFSKKVADFISKTTKGTCVIVDTNADAVKELKKEGIISIEGNALSTDVLPPELGSSIGNLLALTDNRDLNHLICEKWSEYIDKKNLYRWTSQSMEIENQIGGMGKPVWAQIQKPSKMAFELKKEEIFFNHLQIEEYSAQINPASVLLTQNHGQLFFQAPDKKPSGSYQALVFKRFLQRLTDLIHQQHVLFLELSSYTDSLVTIFRQIEFLYPDVKCAQISSELLERESSFPTILAHGVAAPHLHCSGLAEPICFIAKIKNGVDLETYDGERVRLIFVLLSPISQPELHLRLLAQIAKVTSSLDMVNKLVETPNPDDLIRVLSLV